MNEHMAKARALMREHGLDCAIVSNLRNIRYISGFAGSAGVLLLLPDEALLYIDSRYEEQARQQAGGCRIRRHGSVLFADLAEDLAGYGRVAFEEKYVTMELFKRMRKHITGMVWEPFDFDLMRVVKDREELTLIEVAAHLADEAFGVLLNQVRPGMSEREAAALLEFQLKKLGASGTSFSTIVASGPRSSLPHGQPTARRFAAGDLITFDFGAVYDGYCSDMTRTVVLGQADARQKNIYDVVLSAQQAALAALQPGVACNKVDACARDIITRAGYGEFFGHGTGHSLGLAIHEDPRLAPSCQVLLAEGMVVTVEPGIYIPDWGGIRIEDLAVITGDGARILTKTGKELCELPV